MMTTTQSNIYPGMLDENVEFFRTDNGVKIISAGTIRAFKEITPPVYQILKQNLEVDLPALEILKKWYPNSELCQIEKFTECRFGGLDKTPDISQNQLQSGDYWECPFRGNCEGEGKICQPLTFKGEELSAQDIKLMKLLSGTSTNDVIAIELNISLGLFHKIKKKLYAKLEVQTKQEVALIALSLNLVNSVSAVA